MFSRIVVPLDGSFFAESALGPARVLAKAFGSTMLIVRAKPPTDMPFVAQTGMLQGEWPDLEEADDYLNQIVAQLRTEGFHAELTLFVSEAGSGIVRSAELSHADVIVMASHLRWMLSDAEQLKPSTTLSVLARSHVPLFICRAGAPTPSATTSGMGASSELAGTDMPIVVPLDGSRLAEAALPYASALARAFGSYLVLTRSIESSGDRASAEEREAVEYLQAVREEIAQSGGHAIARVQRGIAISGIEAAWRETNAGLIVMASHGAGGPAHPFDGSVAARIIEELEAQVLVIHPQPALVTSPPARPYGE